MKRSPIRNIPGWLPGLAFVLLAVTAFYWFDLRDPYADEGVPVTKPTSGLAKPTPQVVPAEDGLPAIMYELQERVVAGAGVSKPTTAECDVREIPLAPQDFGCTVTYAGLEVPFTVSIIDVANASEIGLASFEWDAKAHKAVITRQGVFDAFWRENVRAGDKNMRCDGDIPSKTLMRPGRTAHFCYSTSRSGNHNRWEVATSQHGLSFLPYEG